MIVVIRIYLLYLQTVLIIAGPGVTIQNASKHHAHSKCHILWAYGKPGNPDPEAESGTGTGTEEIKEWFKLGSMIDINTPPLLSAFLKDG